MMPAQAGLSEELRSLSRLFSYPETWPQAEDLKGLRHQRAPSASENPSLEG